LARKKRVVADFVEDRPVVNSDPLWLEFHLDRLSAEHREAFCLAELGGFTVAEIAGLTGVPEGTVKSRLYHARQKLQSQIQEERGELYVED
jgi:DNA-directed RNA polymerase specialized sigma24 family protein